jgi:hypothetical protein
VFKVLDWHSTVGTAIEKAQVSPYFVVHGASDERVVARCVDPTSGKCFFAVVWSYLCSLCRSYRFI